MSQAMNRYKADLRDFRFLLFEQFDLQTLMKEERYAEWEVEQCNMVLDGAYKFVTEVTGPLNGVGDAQGCRLENGKVFTPEGYKEAWFALYESGWKGIASSEEHGGQGAPVALQACVEEMISGSNTAFSMYAGLTHGAADVIAECGTPEQQTKYVDKMFSGEWSGTMCLTEPQAGSDVGAATTSAKKNPDGTYSIKGNKIFISGGDQDITDNVIHLVLARVEGARAGTKGLSLFIVPRNRVNEDGSAGELNDVEVASIEHKMGINSSSTCALNFGDNDGCLGELVGTVEHQGIAQMFLMMNTARIGVGIQGLSLANAAYLSALEYTKERKQGPSMKNFKDPEAPKVPIIEHADVRRMLLQMKGKAEGLRALAVKLSHHSDWAKTLQGKDDEKAAYHHGQVELLVPLLKSYASDQAFEVAATAIQAMGGAGFLKDYPVEQYCRDSKIFSIYEGTNHIQALDLVGRKLGQKGGANAQAFLKDVATFVAKHRDHETLGKAVQNLGKAQEAVAGTAMKFMMWQGQGKMHLVPLVANRFLNMMSELTLGWLLLEQAIIASEKIEGAENFDKPFYQGKVQSAIFFAHDTLPMITASAAVINAEDDSALQIAEEAFATV